jgi:hypothetical protein
MMQGPHQSFFRQTPASMSRYELGYRRQEAEQDEKKNRVNKNK